MCSIRSPACHIACTPPLRGICGSESKSSISNTFKHQHRLHNQQSPLITIAFSVVLSLLSSVVVLLGRDVVVLRSDLVVVQYEYNGTQAETDR